MFAQPARRAKADRDVNVTTPNLQLFLLGRQQLSGPSNQPAGEEEPMRWYPTFKRLVNKMNRDS